MTCLWSGQASSTATATVGEDERWRKAGKCGVRECADKTAFHILANTAMAGSKTSKP